MSQVKAFPCPRCDRNPVPKEGSICMSCQAEEIADAAAAELVDTKPIGNNGQQALAQSHGSASAAASRRVTTVGTTRKMALANVTTGCVAEPLRVLLSGVEGIGKAQPLDARLLTPYGFVYMGEAAIGMEIIGRDGQTHRITGVYPQGDKQVFRVHMSDGAVTECCSDHLWETRTVLEYQKDRPGSVRSLAAIRETMWSRIGDQNNPRMPHDYPNHRVPVVEPVRFAGVASLPVAPYLLGALIGDGSLTGSSLTLHKPEADVLYRAAKCLPQEDDGVVYDDSRGNIALRIVRRQQGKRRIHSETYEAIEKLGLIGTESITKFVPHRYLTASVDDRLALLRGLCDTDGHVIRSGQRVEYSTSSPRLRDDVLFLIRSLGGTATLESRVPHFSYRGERREGAMSYRMLMFFQNGLTPVASDKHLACWRGPVTPYYRSIAEIEEVGTKSCQCITVDAADGLYVTDDFIVTHNSSWAADAPMPIFIPAEKSPNISAPKFPQPESFADILDAMNELKTSDHPYKTVVLDTIDAIEPIVWKEVIRKDNENANGRGRVYNIEGVGGGYMKGYVAAVDEWRLLLSKLEQLRSAKGMNVILLAHVHIRTFNNPDGENYDRWEMKLHGKAAGLIREWVDAALFTNYHTSVKTDKRGRSLRKGYSDGSRMIYTQRSASFDAKNRYDLPRELPLTWSAFQQAIEDNRNPALLTQEIIDKLTRVGHVQLGSATISELTNAELAKKPSPQRLARINARLNARIEELEREEETGATS